MKTYLQRLFQRPAHNYKPIDGIRAIAVLWVIFFHAWFFPKFNKYAQGHLTDLEIVWENSIISLVIIIFTATLMYLFVEQPFQDLKSRIKTKYLELFAYFKLIYLA